MNANSICKLIAKDYVKNEFGVYNYQETSNTVYCSKSNVSADEFFEGGRNGLNPSLRITLYSFEYNKEQIVEIDNVKYSVYRTYQIDDDHIELYLELKKGNE